MAWVKVHSREEMSWTQSLLSARAPSAMWALTSAPGLTLGNFSASHPLWRIYLSDQTSCWPQGPLRDLLRQAFASRADAARALEDFACLYAPS